MGHQSDQRVDGYSYQQITYMIHTYIYMCVCMYGMIMAQYANHAKPPGFFFKVTPLRFLWMVPWQLDDDPGSPDW